MKTTLMDERLEEHADHPSTELKAAPADRTEEVDLPGVESQLAGQLAARPKEEHPGHITDMTHGPGQQNKELQAQFLLLTLLLSTHGTELLAWVPDMRPGGP